MARAKKTEVFKNLYAKLTIEEMRVLRTELDYAIKNQIREDAKNAQEEEAAKLRDTLKIHDKIKFLVKKETKEGEIVTISVDKVQVMMTGGIKKTVPYQKIIK